MWAPILPVSLAGRTCHGSSSAKSSRSCDLRNGFLSVSLVSFVHLTYINIMFVSNLLGFQPIWLVDFFVSQNHHKTGLHCCRPFCIRGGHFVCNSGGQRRKWLNRRKWAGFSQIMLAYEVERAQDRRRRCIKNRNEAGSGPLAAGTAPSGDISQKEPSYRRYNSL